MTPTQRLLTAVLGVSIFQQAPRAGRNELDSKSVETMREQLGGQIASPPTSQTRWYHQDVENAIHAADRGNMAPMARLWRACRSDGIFAGVLSTRTQGLVRLPVSFTGRPDIVDALQYGAGSTGARGPRSVFFEMCPPGELAAFAADIVGCDIALAELVPVKGRDFPTFTRRDPESLVYIWNEDRWYFRGTVGLVPINPGDGQWVLYVGTRVSPWQNGIWRALGRAYIDKDHARNYSSNWQGKLANPARVATAPESATDDQFGAWFQKVAAWGTNTVFATKPGYKVEIVESNGIGWQSYEKSIARSEREGVIAIAGQEVTTTGGTGFANADIHKSIRADLIKATADALAYAINTQVLPLFVVIRYGIEALADCPVIEWNVEPPKDEAAAAQSWSASAAAAKAWREELKAYGLKLDIAQVTQRYGIPVMGDRDGDGVPDDGTSIQEPANDDGSEDVDLSEFDQDEAA